MTIMLFKRLLTGSIGGIFIFGMSLGVSADPPESINKAACARLPDAEIIWDLNKYRWLCCIPKSKDEYETCMPIRDMQPLPKTSLKPFPPSETQTIEKNPPKQ